jgi:hypothetical protein
LPGVGDCIVAGRRTTSVATLEVFSRLERDFE